MSIFKTGVTTVRLFRNTAVFSVVYLDKTATVYANGLNSPALKNFAAMNFSETRDLAEVKGESHGQIAVDFTNNYVIEPTKEFIDDMFSGDSTPTAPKSTSGYPAFS